MDEDSLELEKARIDEEIRRIRRANAKIRKEDEARALIAAAEGRVSSDIAKKNKTH
jgi:FKBP-type peptidyl-prolyl cis-trans isomerase (trigger factor)